jgi:hypothetical protein
MAPALLITPSSAKASARTVGWRDPGFSDCLPQGAVAKHQVNFSLFLLEGVHSTWGRT